MLSRFLTKSVQSVVTANICHLAIYFKNAYKIHAKDTISTYISIIYAEN